MKGAAMVKAFGYIGLIITKKYWHLADDAEVICLNPDYCLGVPVYEAGYAGNDERNRHAVDYVKQMVNDGYVRFATDEEMKDGDMVPTEVKHVYKYKEDDNATEA